MIFSAVTARIPDRTGELACPCKGGIRMMHLRLLFIACLFLLPMPSLAADDGYGYPIQGSYEATILGTPESLIPKFPAKMRTRQLVLDVIPDRQRPPIFFYDEGLRCTFAYQEKKAPLVFLIAGAGSSDRAPKLLTMMKAFYQAGFHVITLPSPSHANFIISASQSGIPGDLAEDAADLYRVMETAWKRVEGDIEVSSFNLCGYSLGATQAAFVARLDEERRVFNFRKVLMINPSVSLYSSVTRIEELLRQIPGGPKKEGIFFNKMLSKFSQFYHYGNFVAINDDFLYAIYTEHLLSQAETAGLIGLTFRINLAGMIFASDVMTNSGYVVPKNRVLSPTASLDDYFLVSTHLSFFNYFNEYFYPYFQKRRPELTKQALIESQSLRSIEGYLKSSDKFGMMTNENDFILTKEELDYLRELFGDRAKIYPRGGHLGNLEYKDNLAYMVDFFK
jgi:pimeloyl-ACP methyl ester carboxylesterase